MPRGATAVSTVIAAWSARLPAIIMNPAAAIPPITGTISNHHQSLSDPTRIFKLMFESSEDAAAVIDRICAASLAENRAAGARLKAIGELDVLRLRECGERESWVSDTWDAISAEVAAALNISQALASSYLNYSRAMRNRLPRIGAALIAGEISYSTFQTIVYRTDLITDSDVLAAVDAELARRVQRWPSMTRGRLSAAVDRVVARADRDAVRRVREQQTDREFSLWDGGNGLTEVFGRLVTTDARVVDARLNALVHSVCDGDTRTVKQRRADALAALAAGAERLQCRCGQPTCPSAASPAPSPVVIHVVANQSTVDGTAPEPGAVIGTDTLIPAELITQLAESARLRPLVHPGTAPPERGYVPSRALADFVRCRDLTCRFPGCEKPATETDLDHTIPHAQGGATHASNLKCLCRQHHLMKTFWGWRDRQLSDGTVIWTSPSGRTYVTAPGSALLFPDLCAPTAEVTAHIRPGPCTHRDAMMPRRRRTRAENRADYVTAERRRNRRIRDKNSSAATQLISQCRPPDGEPPPF
ncbi:13E12 repeat-containing protein [Mycobacterium lentiflavum]|uniref:13E12 repeat-containing protein n=2 Tax=Mycobacterium lentiflavum TaxID=141349 RepID=A0A0E4H007_MYCLN|nr:13E12 repeat-containing protein [Mycobacterium lentiflavum]